MKGKFNFIGILILIVLSMSLISSFTINFNDFKKGFVEGYKANKETKLEKSFYINLSPNQEIDLPKLYNLKTQEEVSYIPNEVIIKSTKYTPPTPIVLIQYTAALLFLPFILLSLYFYIKFIVQVNKGKIFEKKNAATLRFLGVSLIISFILEVILQTTFYTVAKSAIQLENYSIVYSDSFSYIQLLAGLTALLMAQFITIGVKMREEQELTI